MQNGKFLLYNAFILVLVTACSPKTGQQTTAPTQPTQPTTTPTVDANLSPCKKFSDAPDPDQASTNYVLYRDFLKVNDWKSAYNYWRQVYAVAPAADGKRATVFNDGVRFYEYFMTQTQDSSKMKMYVDSVFMMYSEMERCYPEDSYADARKAFDIYYKYPSYGTKKEAYNLFKGTIDKYGLKTPDFVLNPFTALLTDLYFENQISMTEAQTYQQKVRDILAKGLADCKDKECERWRVIEQYAPDRLAAFETVRGFYDCDYYINKYYEDFASAKTDCDVIREVYTWLRWGGCGDTNAKFTEVVNAGNENCSTAPETSNSNLAKANDCLQNNDYNCAIDNYEKAAAEEKDANRKGKILLTISRIYYSHLKNYSRARQYAQRAADANPNWGEPYILIGRLYASSGPLCGPGRGWDSQIVVWPAIDMWNRAKRVDPRVTAEANKWINRYSQYMPTVEDIFQRSLKEGDSYTVGCWIQESTTIRATR